MLGLLEKLNSIHSQTTDRQIITGFLQKYSHSIFKLSEWTLKEVVGEDRVGVVTHQEDLPIYLSKLQLNLVSVVVTGHLLQSTISETKNYGFVTCQNQQQAEWFDFGGVSSFIWRLAREIIWIKLLLPHIEEKDLNRKSNFKIIHECSCDPDTDRCNRMHCICFLTPREICVIGQCCPGCIESKNQYLRVTRGWQLSREKQVREEVVQEGPLLLIRQKNVKNMHYLKQIYGNDPSVQNLTFCTCKKSHCQKKYCLCFERGVKCGQFCVCIECANQQQGEMHDAQEERRWQRYATYKKEEGEEVVIDHDIDQYMEEEDLVQGQQFDEHMEFEPVNFDNLLSNMYQ